MAYIVGYVSKDERVELERRGWDVEDASRYNLTGKGGKQLLGVPEQGDEAVVIFVDTDVFKVMDGPDWDKGPPKRENDNGRMFCWTRCPKCKEVHGWPEDKGLEGQECECCSYVFNGNEDPNGCTGPEEDPREDR